MKTGLLALILAELSDQLSRLSKAALEAHAAATDPGSKAEGKYDTRSLEASYLASGHARQVEELADAVRRFGTLRLPGFGMDDRIDAGALVEVELAGKAAYFLLAPAAGGLTVAHEGREVTLLTPASGLYLKLLGKRVGDTLDDPPLAIIEIA
ncbi:MAG: transcription elongation factor GreAB [Verrucomicrobia bacterium]|nr:transcription elongation factor GreAB [Verrucomicrobiota bacterium]